MYEFCMYWLIDGKCYAEHAQPNYCIGYLHMILAFWSKLYVHFRTYGDNDVQLLS